MYLTRRCRWAPRPENKPKAPPVVWKTYHIYPAMLLSWMLTMAEHRLVLLTFPWPDQAAVQPPPCLLRHTSCCSPYVTPSWKESSKSTTNPSPTVWAKWFFKMITWKDATYTVTSSDRHELKQRGGLLVRAPSTGMYYFSYCNDYTHVRSI